MSKSRWLMLSVAVAVLVGALLFVERPGTTRSQGASTPTGNFPPSGGHPGIIHGSKIDDVLEGTDADEKIEGLAGSDTIHARGGADLIVGGPGADLLEGGDGDDTYVLEHHGGGPDIIFDDGGIDTLRIEGGIIALSDVELLRHGDDLLVRWGHGTPPDMVLIRSWFIAPRYHIEWLNISQGSSIRLEPLAERAKIATSADMIHFSSRKQ